MREPHTELYVHLVWGTWDRLPMLTAELEPAVYACIQAECRELKVEVIEIGGIENHVHLLARIHPAVSVSTLAKQVKGASSHLVTHRLQHADAFKWQGAYGAYSVSKSDVPRIQKYIQRQREHHLNNTIDEDLE